MLIEHLLSVSTRGSTGSRTDTPVPALRMLTVWWLGLMPCQLWLLLVGARRCEEKWLMERGCGPESQPREPLECSWATTPDPSDSRDDIPGVWRAYQVIWMHESRGEGFAV